MLQARQVELGDERTVALTSQLEVANARVSELETETRYVTDAIVVICCPLK